MKLTMVHCSMGVITHILLGINLVLFQFYSLRKHHMQHIKKSRSKPHVTMHHCYYNIMIQLIWLWLLASGSCIQYSTHVISHLSSYSWHNCLLNWIGSHLRLIKMKYLFVCSIELRTQRKIICSCRLQTSNRVTTHNGIKFIFLFIIIICYARSI